MRKNTITSNKKYRRTYKRAISLATSLALTVGVLPMSEFKGGIGAMSAFMHSLSSFAYIEPSAVYEIKSAQDLIDYSEYYDSTHENDTIIINFITDSTSAALVGFKSIGTESAPFDGKIVLQSDKPLNLPVTMFEYITDDVKMVDASDRPKELVITRTAITQDEPLFAKNVIHSQTGSGKDPPLRSG